MSSVSSVTAFAFAALAAASLSLCSVGCGAPADTGEGTSSSDDALASNGAGESYFLVTCDTAKCNAFHVSRPGKPTTVCPGGAQRATCAVAKLDTTGLSAADRAKALVAASSHAPVGLVVRGTLSLTGSGKLSATQSWAAPSGAGPVNCTLSLVAANTCASGRCAALRVQPLNQAASASRVADIIDFGASPGTDNELDAAKADAFTKVGILAAGQLTSGSAGKLFEANQYLLPLGVAQACTTDLSAIATAAKGLYWESESDFAIETFSRPGVPATALTPAKLLTLLGLPATTATEQRDVDAIGQQIEQCDVGGFPAATCTQYRTLKATFESTIKNVKVIRVIPDPTNTSRIDVYVLGASPCGDITGIKSTVIET